MALRAKACRICICQKVESARILYPEAVKPAVTHHSGAEGKVRIYDKGAFRKGDVTYGDFQYKLHSGDILIPRLDLHEPLQMECAHWIDCIRTGSRPLTDGENGLRVLKVLDAGERSLRQEGAKIVLAK